MMTMKRDGLLPRMEARRRKDGRISYRFHPRGGNPIGLGTDLSAALRKVLDLTGKASDEGTFAHCWRLYQESPEWGDLAERTQQDYRDYSAPLLKLFGGSRPRSITRQDIRRYMIEERQRKVRANREVALLSNLFKVAIDFGCADENMCLGIRYLKERPRKTVPLAGELDAFLIWLRTRGTQWAVIAAMAEFAARTGARRCEFLTATRFQVRDGEARLDRAKQRGGEMTDVIDLSPEAIRLLDMSRKPGCEYLFPSRFGRPYSEQGFKAMFSRAKGEARKAGVITQNFTFHDLRRVFTTEHKQRFGALPDLHKDPGTTARVYDGNKESRRRSL
jgi:integrase